MFRRSESASTNSASSSPGWTTVEAEEAMGEGMGTSSNDFNFPGFFEFPSKYQYSIDNFVWESSRRPRLSGRYLSVETAQNGKAAPGIVSWKTTNEEEKWK